MRVRHSNFFCSTELLRPEGFSKFSWILQIFSGQYKLYISFSEGRKTKNCQNSVFSYMKLKTSKKDRITFLDAHQVFDSSFWLKWEYLETLSNFFEFMCLMFGAVLHACRAWHYYFSHFLAQLNVSYPTMVSDCLYDVSNALRLLSKIECWEDILELGWRHSKGENF